MPVRAETIIDPRSLTIRCELQRRAETIAATGEVQIVWQTYCVVWASETVQTPRQFVSANEILSESRRVFRTHYIPGVQSGDRVVVQPDGMIYDIISVSSVDGRRTWMDIYCAQQQHAD